MQSTHTLRRANRHTLGAINKNGYEIVDETLLRLSFGTKPADWIQLTLAVPVSAELLTQTVSISFDPAIQTFFANFVVRLPYAPKLPIDPTQPTVIFDPGCKTVSEFDERGTTRTCSHCHEVGPAVPPSQRTFICGGTSAKPTKKTKSKKSKTAAMSAAVSEQQQEHQILQPAAAAVETVKNKFGCGFQIPRDINGCLNRLWQRYPGAWRSLFDRQSCKRLRYSLRPVSAANQVPLESVVLLNWPSSAPLDAGAALREVPAL